jgi:hypothetical protein
MPVVLPPEHRVCRWSGCGYVKCIPAIWERHPKVCGPCPGKAAELERMEKRRKREEGR